jgi:hypothetical protein
MMLCRALPIFVLLVALTGCYGREADLKRLWKKTQGQHTQTAYLEFLAEQKPEEDALGTKVFPAYVEKNYYMRNRMARQAIFEIGIASIADSCPFHILHTDITQNISEVRHSLDLEGRWGGMLQPMGVQFAQGAATPDETLVLNIEGAGQWQTYTTLNNELFGRITGGGVQGEMWFASAPDNIRRFSGRAEPTETVWTSDPLSKDYVPGLPGRVLDAARFDDQFVHLLYDTCGPGAAAWFYIDKRSDKMDRDSELEARFRNDSDLTLPLFLAASFGAASYDLIYEETNLAKRVALDVASPEGSALIQRAHETLWPGRNKGETAPSD